MHCSGEPHLRDSMRYRIMHTSSSRCQDLRGSLQLMETQSALSEWRSTLRPSQRKRKATSQGNTLVRRLRTRTPSSAPGVIGNRTAWHISSSHSNAAPTPGPSQTAKLVPRVHNYALKIPWAHVGRGAQLRHAPRRGLNRTRGFPFGHFSFFQDINLWKHCPAALLPNT